ncbi:MAG: hypothetical protein B7Z66_08680 [Chromatiales bacterium 21-64-14]|nr:MAG: hypothetical protein B7Z66_08680 [Chromatiales bacterium 21-64-14]
MDDHFDIAIIGAGLVGGTLACLLDRSGFRVALVEARAPRPPGEMGADPRVWALTLASERILRHAGLWPRLDPRHLGPFREMEVWDGAGSGRIHFDSADIGVSALGHIVENHHLEVALRAQLQDLPSVEWICPAEPAALCFGDAAVQVDLSNGRRLTAGLVVGADGADSTVRRYAGIATHGQPYVQSAVVACVRTEESHRETAWQRFLPEGPVAFLPLADGRSAVVWSTTPVHAQALLAMDESAFLDALREAGNGTLGSPLETGPRAVFPLRRLHADAYVRDGLALVGDAAHTVHPLAGQGVNLGLLDAASLAQVLGEAQRTGRRVGALRVLRRYERWRKGENLGMSAVLDGFQRLFGSPRPPVRWLRNAGLNLTDAARPVKRRIMARASGLAGDLPELARPGVAG